MLPLRLVSRVPEESLRLDSREACETDLEPLEREMEEEPAAALPK